MKIAVKAAWCCDRTHHAQCSWVEIIRIRSFSTTITEVPAWEIVAADGTYGLRSQTASVLRWTFRFISKAQDAEDAAFSLIDTQAENYDCGTCHGSLCRRQRNVALRRSGVLAAIQHERQDHHFYAQDDDGAELSPHVLSQDSSSAVFSARRRIHRHEHNNNGPNKEVLPQSTLASYTAIKGQGRCCGARRCYREQRQQGVSRPVNSNGTPTARNVKSCDEWA